MYTLLPRRDVFSNANVTIIKDKRNALIDSGSVSDPGTRYLTRILKSIGINDIDKIIITHSHVDHCQNAGNLAEKFGAEIIAHENAGPTLKRSNEVSVETFEFWELLEDAYPKLVNGRFNRITRHLIILGYKHLIYGRGKKIDDVTFVKDGDIIRIGETNLEVIFVPGHSNDSICLLDSKKKIIYTGDMIAWTPYIHTSIEDFRNSIKKILTRASEVKVAVRGHGRPHRWEGFEKENYEQFLKDMYTAERRILALLKQHGDLTIDQMISSVFRRTHLVHQLTYRIFMRTQQFWIRKYLQGLQERDLIKSYKEKRTIKYSLT
ncbi:MAG: MBL fold metallo-hydrolase [Candidatus Helarchaeota archaeon]